ncbi:MAG: molybdopterin-dependent oxidoreductase [Proteobacteria bacterium]|nr:molybdopterin-dependent oxidoreductase [Pseudomonadota bacterium]
MKISRRKALSISGTTLAGLSLGVLKHFSDKIVYAAEQEDWPVNLVERPLRTGFPAPLPLNPDGSAPEHPESAAGPISEPLMWRSQGRQTPEIEYDYRRMEIRVDTRGLANLTGTLRYSDLEQLPIRSHTFLLQCGAPNPRGIVKWTGVRFSDFADMLGLIPEAHYCRFVASDQFYMDESLETLRHPQVMLVWLMNDEPIPPQHGAPLRLIIPFRYGNRSIKAITEMTFATPGPRMPPLPA